MKEINRFVHFDKFYNSLEGMYSYVDVDSYSNILTPQRLLEEKRYHVIFLKSEHSGGDFEGITHNEGIFKYPSGFYIYMSRLRGEVKFVSRIIYKPEQYEEIKLFIRGLERLNDKIKSY